MHKPFLLSSRRSRLLAAGILGVSPLILPCRGLHAQTISAPASANATINPSGVRTGVNGTNFFNVEASGNGTNATFGVLDFSNSVLNPNGQTATAVQGNTLTLSLTESNSAFTAPTTLEFYLTTVTGANIVAGTSTLKYNGTTAGGTPLFGIDTGLGAPGGNSAGTLYDLGSGSFTTTGATGTGTTDTYTLTLGTGLSAFLSELNTSGGNVRLVIASTTAAGAGTYFGATNTTNNTTTYKPPTLSFAATFAIANALNWQGGSGGSWTPTGTTNWSTSSTTTGNAPWNNDGTATAIFGNAANTVNINAGNINAAGAEFDVNGYTINGTGAGNTLTLTGNHLVNVVNATDTATINAPIAGSVGLTKSGAGTLVLGGASTYTGTTTVGAGTLSISSNANLGNGGAVALSGGALQTTGSFTLARAFTGSGGVGVASGSTLTISGLVNMGTLTLPGSGTVLLTNTDFSTLTTANGAFTGLTFQTAGATLQTQNAATTNGMGVVTLGTGGITAAQSSGTVSAASIFQVTGTVPVSVANAAATLNLSGIFSGAAVLAKTGAGTLVINSDNSGLTGTGAIPASFRQGTSSATLPVSGGVASITASNPNPGAALGVAEFQANGGTLSNDTGTAIVLTVTDISLGAQDATGTPGGHVFAGNGAITVNGPLSLFNSGTTLYQHTLTVNTPTTITGILSAASSTATKSLGLTLRGSSTLTLNATGRGTMTEPITIATSGTTAGVIALAEGTFAANTAVTINGGARLTIQTGVLMGTTDTINDAAVLTINGTAGTPASFGKLALTLGTGVREAVGGFYLPVGDGTLAAGYQPAGTYGATGSGAQFVDNTLFSGLGVINNLGTVPEPSTWATLGLGGLLGFAMLRRRRTA